MSMSEGGGVFLKSTSRQGDMGEGLKLEVLREDDGDLIVSIMGVHDRFSPTHAIQFCVPGTGGGTSPKTWRALLDLQAAMYDDNLGRPQRVPPRPEAPISVVLTDFSDEGVSRNGVVTRDAFQAAFLQFGGLVRGQKGGMPVELGIPEPHLFESATDYRRRLVQQVDESRVCGYLEDIRINGHQVCAMFRPGGPHGDKIKSLHYKQDYDFGLRYALARDGHGKEIFAGPFAWSVISPTRVVPPPARDLVYDPKT